MNAWRRMQLGAVARVERSVVDPGRIQSGTKYVGLEHVDDDGKLAAVGNVEAGTLKSTKFRFSDQHVLYGKLRPYLRKVARPHFSGICSTDILPILPGPDLDRDFLFHLLRQPRIVSLAATRSDGVNLPRVSPKTLLSFPVSLPPLAEQRRIAAMLDKADAIRRKRQESLQLLDGFQRSAFASLAGRANKNYQRWPQVTIASLANGPGAIRTGPFGSALRHSEFVDSGVAVLGIDNAVQNRFAWSERRFITHEKFERFKRYTVKPGDVLITIMGTTGRSSVVPYDIPLAISTKHLAVITVDRSRVHPLFLSHAIHSDSTVLAQIAAANRGAIMSGLNLAVIKRLNLRLPPLADQEQFAAVVNRVGEAQERFAGAVREMDRLFESLAQRAFSGGV